MSNSLAIAAVTATLKSIVGAIASKAVNGAKASADRLASNMNIADARVNIYLYHVAPNVALRNTDLPNRTAGGSPMAMPQVALDLYYLFSFFGAEQEYVPQRLLGAVVSSLYANPALSAERIKAAASAEAENTMLHDADLDTQIERVRVALQPLSLEELSKLWSVFFQAPYVLSVAYQVSVVLITGEQMRPAPALPVRRIQVGLPGSQPVIESVAPMTVGPEDTLVITGRHLWVEGAEVWFDDASGQGGLGQRMVVTDSRIELPLPPGLRAGMRRVYIKHPLRLAAGEQPPRWRVSNMAVFVLRPTISGIMVNQRPFPSTGTIKPKQTLRLTIDPPCSKDQKVTVLLNKINPKDSAAQSAYAIDVPLNTPKNALSFANLNVKIPATIEADTYTIRVQVDGAESNIYSSDHV